MQKNTGYSCLKMQHRGLAEASEGKKLAALEISRPRRFFPPSHWDVMGMAEQFLQIMMMGQIGFVHIVYTEKTKMISTTIYALE